MNQEKSINSEKIKVIWIDDDPSRVIDTEFFKAGIITKTFKLAEDAKKEFITHRGSYQAIILDMEGADKTVNEFARAIKEFEDLQKDDPIPIYIFTSYSESDPQYKAAEPTIYQYKIKGNRFYNKKFHREELIAQIKKDALECDRFKIYKKYELAFEAFESGILDKKLQESLFAIIGGIEGKRKDYLGLFNVMRKIYEMVFYEFLTKKLPSNYYYGFNQGRLTYDNESENIVKNVRNYLYGREITVSTKVPRSSKTIQIKNERILPQIMANIIDNLFEVLCDDSHFNPGNNWSNDRELQEMLPNFYQSTALLLIDLISWAKKEIKDSDEQKYLEKNIIPADQQKIDLPIEQPKENPVPYNFRKLVSGEKLIEVRLALNRRGNGLNINNADNLGPNVFFQFWDPRVLEIVEKLRALQTDQRVKVIVKDAYEIKEFGI